MSTDTSPNKKRNEVIFNIKVIFFMFGFLVWMFAAPVLVGLEIYFTVNAKGVPLILSSAGMFCWIAFTVWYVKTDKKRAKKQRRAFYGDRLVTYEIFCEGFGVLSFESFKGSNSSELVSEPPQLYQGMGSYKLVCDTNKADAALVTEQLILIRELYGLVVEKTADRLEEHCAIRGVQLSARPVGFKPRLVELPNDREKEITISGSFLGITEDHFGYAYLKLGTTSVRAEICSD